MITGLAQRIRQAFDGSHTSIDEQIEDLSEVLRHAIDNDFAEAVAFDATENEALGKLSNRLQEVADNASKRSSIHDAQERRLSAINRAQAIVELHRDETVAYANDNFLSLVGRERGTVEGQSFRSFLESSKLESWRHLWTEVSSSLATQGDVYLSCGNGQEITTRATCVALPDGDGDSDKVIVTFRDITDLANHLSQAERAWSMLEHTPTSTMFADENGIIEFANAACQKELQALREHLPFDPDSLVGLPIERFHSDFSQSAVRSGSHHQQIEFGPETVSVTFNQISNPESVHVGQLITWKIITRELDDTAEIARMSSMVDQAPANVMFADTDLIVRYMNPASHAALRKMRPHLNVDPDALIGESIEVFAKDKQRQRTILADPANLPVRMQRTIGSETVDLLVSPLYDDNKNYLGAMLTWEVITERIAREQAEVARDQQAREQTQAEALEKKAEVILELVRSLANGRFDLEFPNLGDDAIGKVASGLAQAVHAVRNTLSEVRDGASTVATAATEMSKASEEISRGAQQQAERLDETASSLEEITATVKQNSESAKEARVLANGSRDVATEGGKVVGAAVQAMSEINDASKKIGEIITTIDEIAFQTNLLALNAAVEAARAGEQGRGFAVVASEVRNLAQRSASSAKEIKALIQDSNSKVEKGTKLVNMSGETLGDIVESVQRVTDIVVEIAAASESQLAGIEQVNSAMNQMDRVTQTNANQTEELAGTSSSVLNTTRQLDDMVSQFQLGVRANR